LIRGRSEECEQPDARREQLRLLGLCHLTEQLAARVECVVTSVETGIPCAHNYSRGRTQYASATISIVELGDVFL
jgi:hypothetical protein